MLKSFFILLCKKIPIYREIIQNRDLLAEICGLLKKQSIINAYTNSEILRKMNSRYNDPKRLHNFAFQVNSQNDEDGIIHEIFKRIGITKKIFVEIGVGDGKENNTAFLLSQGWKGFWFDGDDSFLNYINSRNDLGNGCIIPSILFVDKENIIKYFELLKIPVDFDLLSIDIDQNTYYIWEVLVEYKPRVVVIEYNAVIPPDIEWKAEYNAKKTWDGSHNYGASLKAYEILGSRLGYSLVGCDFNGINAFFIRNDLVNNKFCPPYTSENHYEPARHAFVHRKAQASTILDRKK